MNKRIQPALSLCLTGLFCIPYVLFPGMGMPGENPVLNPTTGAAADKRVASTSKNIRIEVEALNCPVWGYCDAVPQLRFTLSGADLENGGYLLYVVIEDKVYEFTEGGGVINVEETSSEGVKVTYWAESATSAYALADSSFRMRYIPSGRQFVFQLLGEQWLDEIPGGVLVWEMFPSMEIFEYGWAQRITDEEDLYTTIDYTLLAGKLIWEGIVTPKDCPNRGLLANGAADTCGMEAAREKVIEWQNRYNAEIMDAALDSHVPARLLKGMIGQESQFYAKWQMPDEYGLGMLTEHGVDMLLQWNEAYYMKKCGLIYGADYCENGYLNLTDEQQAVLIGYVIQEIGTEKEYHILAEALYASCFQANYIVSYYSDKAPNQVTDYETMWRIAMGIYHAGFGCVADGVSAGWGKGDGSLEWENIQPYLIGDCSSAADYFDKVTLYVE